jgi:CelD/BcsL family acetyltransferase involved in cellulose biosynthesis
MFAQPAITSPAKSVTTANLVTNEAAFDRLLCEWDSLLADSTSSTPFLKAGWIDCWRRHAMGGHSLHVLEVREHGRLAGIAPLRRVRGSFSLSDRLEFLGTGPAGADYLDAIVRDGAGPSVIAAVAASLDASNLPLYLDHLPPGSNADGIAAALQRFGWAALHDSPDVCPFIDLSGHTWDSYLASIGSSHRANIRRRMRALDASFTVDFTLVDSDGARREALDQLIGFNRRRWDSRGGTTAFPDAEIVAFHEALTSRAMSEGWLRLYTLSLNGAIAAVIYGFALDRRFYFYQHGFDSAYGGYSLGLVLMALTVRAAIDAGMREFDMLYGHESYKALWARQQRPLSRLQLFPPRVAGRLLRRQAETRRALRQMARQLGLTVRHDHP